MAEERNKTLVRKYREQKAVCYLCGGMMTLKLGCQHTATIEHIIPKSRQPLGAPFRNKKAACYSCNQDKANLTEIEFRATHRGAG